MVKCTFCNKHIQEGTGVLFVHKSGRRNYFCSSKCEKNSIKLGRKSSKFKWSSK